MTTHQQIIFSTSHPQIVTPFWRTLRLVKQSYNGYIMLRVYIQSIPAATIRKCGPAPRHFVLVGCDNKYVLLSTMLLLIYLPYVLDQNPLLYSIPSHLNILPITLHRRALTSFDQLLIMIHQHQAARNDTAPRADPLNSPPVTDAIMANITAQQQVK